MLHLHLTILSDPLKWSCSYLHFEESFGELFQLPVLFCSPGWMAGQQEDPCSIQEQGMSQGLDKSSMYQGDLCRTGRVCQWVLNRNLKERRGPFTSP